MAAWNPRPSDQKSSTLPPSHGDRSAEGVSKPLQYLKKFLDVNNKEKINFSFIEMFAGVSYILTSYLYMPHAYCIKTTKIIDLDSKFVSARTVSLDRLIQMPSVRGRALISLTLMGPRQNTPGNSTQLNRKNVRFLIIPGLNCA